MENGLRGLNSFPLSRNILSAMTSNDELTLLRRIATKDRKAFEALYHIYYRRLFGYLLKLTRRAELVEEVLNDVMLAIWKGAGSFDGRSRPSTWIFGIAYHKALKALARRPVEGDGGPDNGPEPVDRDEPASVAARRALAAGRRRRSLCAWRPGGLPLLGADERDPR